jgi:hypothetical protein
MKKLMTIVFATLFAASSGAFAAAHMKGEKDMTKDSKATAKADSKKGDMKKGDAKNEKAKKGEGKKADPDMKKSDKAASATTDTKKGSTK